MLVNTLAPWVFSLVQSEQDLLESLVKRNQFPLDVSENVLESVMTCELLLIAFDHVSHRSLQLLSTVEYALKAIVINFQFPNYC